MPGTVGRSGGFNANPGPFRPGDGQPEPPRKLTAEADACFTWLLQRLGTDSRPSPWHRVDGTVVATFAELLESQEHLATALAQNPADEKLLRLRLQYAQQIGRFSSLLGMTPRDRDRCPQVPAESDQNDAVAGLMKRLGIAG